MNPRRLLCRSPVPLDCASNSPLLSSTSFGPNLGVYINHPLLPCLIDVLLLEERDQVETLDQVDMVWFKAGLLKVKISDTKRARILSFGSEGVSWKRIPKQSVQRYLNTEWRMLILVVLSSDWLVEVGGRSCPTLCQCPIGASWSCLILAPAQLTWVWGVCALRCLCVCVCQGVEKRGTGTDCGPRRGLCVQGCQLKWVWGVCVRALYCTCVSMCVSRYVSRGHELGGDRGNWD